MIAKINKHDKYLNQSMCGAICGYSFEWVKLNHADFTALFNAPDPIALLEQLYSRMAFPNEIEP